MMKLSFEVEDSNETTNCSPSPHPENEVNMLEEKSLHALVYNVKRTPVDLEEEENGEREEIDGMVELSESEAVKEESNELREQASGDEVVETKEKLEGHGEVGLSIEDLREQYTALQQQMALLQQQLVNQNQQQQQQVGSPVDNTLQQQQMALFQQQLMLQQQQPSTAADANLHMQHLQQQQLMMQQQIMLQQMHNPQGIPAAMMMQQPGVIMVPVAAAPPMQMTSVTTESMEKSEKDKYSEQTDMATQHTPGSPKNETKNREKDAEVRSDKKTSKNYPFKMLSQGQNKGKSLKYSSYIMSAKREFARKEAQRPRTNSTPPQASVSPSVVETEQRWRANTVDSEAVLQDSEGQKSKVNDESNANEGGRLPEAVVQPMSHIENEAPEPVDTGITNEAPEHVENESGEHTENDAHVHTENPYVENSDTDHATITFTSTSASNATNSSATISSSADVETASLTTISEGTTSNSTSNVEETDTNKQASIPQARVAPVVAAKPQSRGPARRISVKTERDHEVEKIGSVGSVSKFRQVGRLLNRFCAFLIMLFCKFGWCLIFFPICRLCMTTGSSS